MSERFRYLVCLSLLMSWMGNARAQGEGQGLSLDLGALLAMDVTVAASGSVKNSWWSVPSTRDRQTRVAAAATCD